MKCVATIPKVKTRSNCRCDIPNDLSDDPLFQCKEIMAKEIIPHVLDIQSGIEKMQLTIWIDRSKVQNF